MEVIEAIKCRQSVRAFKPEPISTQILRDILEVAIHAPSGVNAQPWEFFILKGEVLDRLKAGCVEQFRQGIGPGPDLPLPKGDMGLQGIYRKRQVTLGIQIFKVLGIAKGDRQAMMDYVEQMYRFFEAPAIIIIVVDEMFKLTWPMIDVGALTQSIALTALEFDLGTCIMRAIVDYPAKVKEVAGIPESKKIILGLTIGRPDWDHPINQFRSVREDLENLLT
ncbi:MAG: nitroreductase, partial [Deltaproteobacteria bacterium]|nr:nitroreductase [Deltaproteobacteria bacterium]